MPQRGRHKHSTKTNLIVNYVPPELTSEQFRSLFERIGPISSIRMMKNQDGTPQGFGFVRFTYPADAQRAIDIYNGFMILGKRLKITYTRTGGPRKDCNIFTTNLPATWTTQTLYEVFGEFGEILEARVLTHSNGRSRLCGFVRFDDPEEAKEAIRHYNHYVPPGAYRPIKARLAAKQADHWKAKGIGPYSPEKARMLRYKCGVSQQSSSHSQQRSSSHVKSIDEASMPSIDIVNPPSILPGKQTTPEKDSKNVTSSDDTGSDKEGCSIFLCNVPTVFGEEDIKHFCGKYGKILEIEIQKSKNGESLGMVFIRFNNEEEAQQARDGLDNCKVFDKVLTAKMTRLN